MNPCVRNPLFGLLVLTVPLAACARPAADAAPVSAAITSTIAQSSAPQIVTGLPDFTKLVETVGPGVVNIEAKVTPKKVARQQQMPDDEEIPEFFRRFFGPGMPMPGQPQPRGGGMSAGSGFIISPDGYVLTNQHVVEGADTVTVKLTDRREFKAKVVGGDPQYDVALLKIDATGLPSIRIGDSNRLKPGQWVVAIGSPFGMDHSVTAGIVSAVGRSQGNDQRYVPFIQTDVAINPGNSGGPLLNTSGEVVGINSQIFSRSGGYMGISFAIPIDLAMGAAEQLKKTGRVERGQLGVMVRKIDADRVKGFGLPDTRGALIDDMVAGGAGEKAGLQRGDVIRSVNGTAINDSSDLPPIIGAMAPGAKVRVGILRDGKPQEITATLTALKEDDNLFAGNDDDSEDGAPGAPVTAATDILGISVAELGAEARRQLGLKAGEGIRVVGVEGESAMEAGLQPGLVILQVGRTPVGSITAFNQQLRGVKAGDVVMLLVRIPQGGTRFLAVTAGKD